MVYFKFSSVLCTPTYRAVCVTVVWFPPLHCSSHCGGGDGRGWRLLSALSGVCNFCICLFVISYCLVCYCVTFLFVWIQESICGIIITRALDWCYVPSAKCAFICIAVRVRPVHGSVRTFARCVELYLGRLLCTHCMRLTLFTGIVYVQLVPEFCITLPVLKHGFFIIIWCCCCTVIYANTSQYCLFTSCVVNGALSVSHENYE